MTTHTTNIFIVDDNKVVLTTLKLALENAFMSSVLVSTFTDGESCLNKINQLTHIVILDYYLDGKNGLEILKLIKEKNPLTEVVMLTSNEDAVLAVKAFREGASDFVIKDRDAVKSLIKMVQRAIQAPIRLLVKEFGVSKFVAIFLTTFVTMAIVVAITLFII